MSDSLLTGKRCFVLDDEFLIALDIQQILERAGAAHGKRCLCSRSYRVARPRAEI